MYNFQLLAYIYIYTEFTVELKPQWPKAHSRVATALFGLKRLPEAAAEKKQEGDSSIVGFTYACSFCVIHIHTYIHVAIYL